MTHFDIGITELSNLTRASSYYFSRGYQEKRLDIEVPKVDIEITKPKGATHIETLDYPDYALVASAEQSFLTHRIHNNLLDGKYFAVTPCFRDEPEDETHCRLFMKVELIEFSTQPIYEDVVERMAREALGFMAPFFPSLEIVHTEEAMYSRDIICSLTGIELGSYGVRYNEQTGYWAYGTGIAEPRFSRVRNLALEKRNGR